jgi:hypothetical protein
MNTMAAVMPPAIMAVRFVMMEEVVLVDVEREVGKGEVTCVQGWQRSSKNKWLGNVQ